MCLAWARDHVTWTQNDWAPVLFTDKSRFCVDFTDRRARIWRMPNERFAPVCVAEHDRFGGGSVMVWAGISAHGKMDLHVIDNGTLTALRYVNEILDVYVRPYAGAVGENFILMDDNCYVHTQFYLALYMCVFIYFEWFCLWLFLELDFLLWNVVLEVSGPFYSLIAGNCAADFGMGFLDVSLLLWKEELFAFGVH